MKTKNFYRKFFLSMKRVNKILPMFCEKQHILRSPTSPILLIDGQTNNTYICYFLKMLYFSHNFLSIKQLLKVGFKTTHQHFSLEEIHIKTYVFSNCSYFNKILLDKYKHFLSFYLFYKNQIYIYIYIYIITFFFKNLAYIIIKENFKIIQNFNIL